LRKRSWVLIIPVLLVAITILLPRIWQWSRMDEKIRDYLLGKMQPVLGDSCAVEDVRISFSNLHLLGLYIPHGKNDFTIRVEDLRIGFNPFSFLRYGMQPQALSQDIMAKRLHIMVRASAGSGQGVMLPQSGQIREYLRNLQKLDFLKMISIQEGEIALELPGRETLSLISGLEGWLITESQETLQLRLSGHPLRARQSVLTLAGGLGLQEGMLDTLHATIARMPLADAWPWRSGEGLRILGGELQADLSFSLRPGQVEEMDLTGSIRVADLAAVWPDQHLHCDQTGFTLQVQDDRAEVTDASGWINQTPLRLAGAIEGVARPRLALHLTASDIDPQSFDGLLPEPLRSLSGRLTLAADIAGELSAPQLRFTLNAPALHWREERLEQVRLIAALQGDSLQIESLQGSWQTLQWQASGLLMGRLDSTRLTGSLRVEGDLLPLLPPAYIGQLQGARISLTSRISGRAAAPAAEGGFSLTLASRRGAALTTAYRFSLLERRFQLNPASESEGALKGIVDWSNPEPQFALSVLSARSWMELVWPELAEPMRRNALDLTLHLNHLGGNWGLQAQLRRRVPDRRAETLFGLSSRFERAGRSWKGAGTLAIWPGEARAVKGHFTLTSDSTRFMLRDWTMGEWFSGLLQISSDGVLAGSCFLQELPVESLLGDAAPGFKGLLDGEILFTGTTRQPRIHSNLRLDQAWVRAAGPFQCEGAITADGSGVVLERLLLTNDETNLLFANGWHKTAGDSLYLRLQGAGFEMLRISPAFMPGEKPFTGQTVTDLEITGTLRQPQIKGQLRIQNGSCYGIAFDELKAQFGPDPEPAPPAGLDSPPALLLQRLAFHRQGELELFARGRLPLHKQDEFAIDLQGAGNFLALLSDIDIWFQESRSDGRLTARIGGTWQRPRIRDATLSIRNGMMRCETVLPVVTGMSADLTYKPEAQFVQIENLQAEVGGRPVRIRSQLSHPGLSARPLENLVFPRLGGLNFGVLAIDSGDEGIELNILGLMERGKFGTFWLGGRLPGESFYCAGPIERPVFRGLVKAANVQFMFPFDETLPPMKDSVVVKVLLSADWDMAVRILKDVRYVKFLPGGLDKVYTNILVEEGGDDIEFTGVTIDSTFRILGQARTTSGVIEYLDMTFRIEQGGVRWDRASLYPITWGQARTTITDSLGFTSQIFLTVQTVDETMEKKEVEDIVRQEERLGRWDKIRFKMSTDNPTLGTTEAQLLASLGYSERTLQTKAVDVIGINTENYLLRPFFRPMEKTLENLFRFDYVRFSSRFTRNFLDANLNNNPQLNNRLALLRSSKLILGKFISSSIFMQYTGQIESGVEYRYQAKGVGLRHTLGIEYRISPQVLLELEYDYDSLMLYNREDKRIMVRHWFPF
jgi:hypothetical protein